MPAYYNEFDPKKAAWLRELIKRNLIAPGEVDERSIEDVLPDELRRFSQCHFFAGVGGWSLSLRKAGWPDERPVWTGSCPCQPFSAAGKGKGFADERHLWPAFFHLYSQFRTIPLFGEQVASSDGLEWFDLVQADLEAIGNTVGMAVLPAAGFGSPQGRHRIYFVADSGGKRPFPAAQSGIFDAETDSAQQRRGDERRSERRGSTGIVANGNGSGHSRQRRKGRKKAVAGIGASSVDPCRSGSTGSMAGTDGGQSGNGGLQRGGEHGLQPESGYSRVVGDSELSSKERQREHRRKILSDQESERLGLPGPTNGFWRDAEWLHCAPEPGYPEGRWRAVEPGTFPLAHGIPARVVRISGYGNAIVPQVAEEFIKAFMTA